MNLFDWQLNSSKPINNIRYRGHVLYSIQVNSTIDSLDTVRGFVGRPLCPCDDCPNDWSRKLITQLQKPRSTVIVNDKRVALLQVNLKAKTVGNITAPVYVICLAFLNEEGEEIASIDGPMAVEDTKVESLQVACSMASRNIIPGLGFTALDFSWIGRVYNEKGEVDEVVDWANHIPDLSEHDTVGDSVVPPTIH